MGTVYEELDDAKAEIEKLKANYQIKLEFSESLKRAHNEQLVKFQEVNLKVGKLSQELNEKAEEISVANQMYEELKSKLKEKEAVIEHLTCANDKLRADYKEKLQSSEEENRGLALALDEANAKNMDQEQLIRSLQVEVEGLKGIVSASQNKCSEADRKHKALQEVRQGEDVLLKLEDEKSKYENQLKWKKEQFGHLEEAHKKLRHEFQVCQKEWEKERVSLLDEISRLQTNLDSQTRISESLKSRLEMCNQALAHEESKRKYLEVQLSESRTNFDNVFADYEEAKSTIESLTGQRDKEIASLRNSLCTKESIYKEMQHQVRVLDQDKQELMISLRELQEAQIREGGSASSLTKLRNKLRGVEQVHKDCSMRLMSKEAEWNSQLEILMQKLSSCSSELESKNTLIDQLKMEAEAQDSMIAQLASHNEEVTLMVLLLKSGLLEAQMKLADAYVDLDHERKKSEQSLSLFRGLERVHKYCSERLRSKEAEWNSKVECLMEKLNCCSSELESKSTLIDRLKMEAEAHDSTIEQLTLQNEAAGVVLLLLKSGFLEAQMKLAESYVDLEETKKKSEDRQALLLEQLELKNIALAKAHSDTEKERKKVAHLSEKVESVTYIEEQQLLQHKELERLEKLLSESYTCQHGLKKQVLSMTIELKEVCNALNAAYQELDDKTSRGMEFEFELQIWKPFAQGLRDNLEENHQLHREAEASFHAQVMSLKSDLKKVRKTLARANEELAARFCEGNQAEFELQIWKSIAEQLKANLEDNHHMRREVEASLLAEISIQVNLRQERDGLLNQLDEKDKRLEELGERITFLNQEIETRAKKDAAPDSTKNAKFYSSRTSLQSPDGSSDYSQEEEEWVKRQLEGAIFAQVDAEQNHEHERESLHHLVEERDQRIEHLQQLVKSLEQEFESSTSSFSSRLSEMQVEIKMFHDFWHKMATTLFLKEMEIQEKDLINAELENDLSYLKTGSLANKSEVQILRDELEKEQSRSDALIQKLNEEKGRIIEDVVKLSSDRENLLDTLEGLYERMQRLSMDDLQLMEGLRNILHNFNSTELGIDFRGEDEYFDPVKENKIHYASPRTTKAEVILDERLPLRAVNSGLLL
ncbi:uncharacterized protein At4g38062-like [Coffea arabica]|uniref:Uncharacterized protein At4g38062-like n=1 Tax=Coffea arabica TaxID=13443 RepID=A0A6P6TD91_COFAR|nr:uncharacterized protein At4g38062-like [Coffea arabica]